MLLKVSDGTGGWVVFDKVDHAHFLSDTHTVNTIEEFQKLTGETALSCIQTEVFAKGQPVPVGIVEFEKRKTSRRAFFTDICYLCNDAGDTLDRFRVPNGHKKG